MSKLSLELIEQELSKENPDVYSLQLPSETLVGWSLRYLDEVNPASLMGKVEFIKTLLNAMKNRREDLFSQLERDVHSYSGIAIKNLMASISGLDRKTIVDIFTSKKKLFPKTYLSFMTQQVFDILIKHVQEKRDDDLFALLINVVKKLPDIQNSSFLAEYQSVSKLYSVIEALRNQYNPGKGGVIAAKFAVLSDVIEVLKKYKKREFNSFDVKSHLDRYFAKLKIIPGKYDSISPPLSRMQPILRDLESIFNLSYSDCSNSNSYKGCVEGFFECFDRRPHLIEIMRTDLGGELLAMMAADVDQSNFSMALDEVDKFSLPDRYRILLLANYKYSLLTNTLHSISYYRKLHQLITANADRVLLSIEKLPANYQLELLLGKTDARNAVFQAQASCPKLLPKILKRVLSVIDESKFKFANRPVDLSQLMDTVFAGPGYCEKSHALLLLYVSKHTYKDPQDRKNLFNKLPNQMEPQKLLNSIYNLLIELREITNQFVSGGFDRDAICETLENLLKWKSGEQQSADLIEKLKKQIDEFKSSEFPRVVSYHNMIAEVLNQLNHKPPIIGLSIYGRGGAPVNTDPPANSGPGK